MKDPVTQLILKFCGPILTAAWLCGDAPAANADDLMCSEFRPGSSVETPLPVVTLNGPDRITNECHSAFTDPGATARGGPVAIAAGLACSLALQRDGVMVAWGAATNGSTGEPYGESVVPSGLGKVAAIAAGGLHSLALKRDGTIVAWGYNGFGQTNVPEGLSNVIAIAGGGYHSLALQRDGTVVAWGYNNQTDVPAGLSNVVAIAGGGAHSLALKRDGTVAAWGYNTFGQTSVPVGLSNVVAIAGGTWHSLALRRDGTVAAWGYDLHGESTVPASLHNVVAIAGGGWHSLALQSDGLVVAWGENLFGQTNVPASLNGVVAIAGGGAHSLALQHDGTVVGWGDSYKGQTTVPAGLSDLSSRITVSGAVDDTRPGSYALSYSVTDLFGNTATTNRILVVVDTTPPAFGYPTNLVIPCVGTARVPVYFNPEATDLCSGPVPVSCVPVSGSLFPVGTAAVVCTATDASGNTASRGFTVTVQGARAATEDVVRDLVALKLRAVNPRDAKKLDEAIEALNEALSPSVWRDDTHLQAKAGNRVFQQEKASVNALLELIRKEGSAIPNEPLSKLVECIVKNLRLLAVIEIEDAAAARADSRKIAEAEEQVATGDEDLAAGKWAVGIEHYRNAWNHAMQLQIRIRASASDGRVRVGFLGLSGRTYILEASTNLTDWTMVASRTSMWDGMVTIEDSEATACNARFYRVSSPP